MIQVIYVDDDEWQSRADHVVGADFRVDLICGAALSRGAECDRARAALVIASGLLFIFGPPPGRIYRAPGTNAYDHLDHASSSAPGAAHQLWEGYPIGYDFDGEFTAQALWKVRLRGCLEHNPTPDLSALATRLRDTLIALHAAGWPRVPFTLGQLDDALARTPTTP